MPTWCFREKKQLAAPAAPSPESIEFSQPEHGVKRKSQSDPIESSPPRGPQTGVKRARPPLPRTTGARTEAVVADKTEVPETPLSASVGESSSSVRASSHDTRARTGCHTTQPGDLTSNETQ